MGAPGRNDTCPCGSGKKYKKCCQKQVEVQSSAPHPSRQAAAAPGNSPATRAAILREIDQLVALFNSGKHADLENYAHLMLRKRPDAGIAWKFLGASLLVQGKDALPALQKAVEILPADFEVHNNLGVALHKLGKFEQAAASYQRALLIQPDYAEAYNNLGAVLHDLRQFEDAAANRRKAIQLRPDYADAHYNLGNDLRKLRQFEDAVSSYRRALGVRSGYVEAHINLGNTLLDLGRTEEAVESFRRVLQIRPDYPEAHYNLGNALRDMGQLQDAASCFRQALKLKPDYAEAHTALLFLLSHGNTLDVQALFAEHCRYGEQFEAPWRAGWPQHANSKDPERRLRIGFVSGDLHNHAVACFIEPVFAHLADHPELVMCVYYNNTIEDNITRRLRGYVKRWHQVEGLPDSLLATRIREDSVDILIDLSGHTGQNRLPAFARKLAPVQASWLGYPGTTGLRAMDYYLADHLLLPSGLLDDQFTEKIVRLPASVPYLPSKDAPPVNSLPALDNGHVTFGSFNRINKLNREIVALWSQLLRALPDSRMVLGGMPENGKYERLTEWFGQEGIAPERLEFHQRCSMARYLDLHHKIDICLDTFPYNGGTTTYHALWMGVPTITLAGGTAAARSGAAILGHAGLEAFVARDAADFVQNGLSWAGRLEELSGIRAKLRERVAGSELGQPELISACLARALRIMWRRWCTGKPVESFEVTRQDIEEASGEEGR